MHVDGAGQLRMLLSNGLKFQRFAGFRARGSWRPSGRIGHHAIIAGSADSDGRLRGATLCKNGRIGRRARALPKALMRLGHTVDLVIPRYRGISVGHPTGNVRVALGGQVDDAQIHAVEDEGLRTIFIGHPAYFDREFLYGAAERDYPDNPERFAFFCQAALDWAASTGQPLRRHPRARLAGGPHPGAPGACGFDTVSCAYAHRVHDSQSGLSGSLRRELAAAPRSRLGSDARGRDGILGTHQLSQGWRGLQPARDHGQPHVCAGDPDTGPRLRL